MGRHWIGSSANQAPLERVLDLIRQHGRDEHGKLIIVRGKAGAGASAFASRLHSMLSRRNIRSVFVPRSPVNNDFVFSSHFLKALGLPLSSLDLASGRRVRRHYEAAIHLRRYQAVICEDAHDFFHKYQVKIQNVYDSIQQMTQPPYSHCMVLCGLCDPMTVVGQRAMGMGMDVEFVDLKAMSCDRFYLAFVQDVAAAESTTYRISPFLYPITVKEQVTPQVTGNDLDGVPLHSPIESELAAEHTQLGAACFLALSPSAFIAHGLDVRVLHAHTKGLVGNTVSVVRGLIADSKAIGQSKTDDTPASNALRLREASHSTPPDISSEPSSLAELPGLNETSDEISSAGSGEKVLNQSNEHNDQATCQPVLTEEIHSVQSDAGSVVELSMSLAGQSRASSETQLSPPFISIKFRQMEVQSELPPEARPVKAPQLIGLQMTASGKEVSERSEVISPLGTLSRFSGNDSIFKDSSARPTCKRNRVFYSYLTPIHDETLGSWLSRNATSNSVTTIHDGFLDWCTGLLQPVATSFALSTALDFIEVSRAISPAAKTDDADEQGPWDPEVLLGNPRSQDNGQGAKDLEYDDLYRSEAFLHAFPGPVSTHLAASFRLSSNAVTQQENRRFCAQCLADDVAAMRSPGLRRAWRHRGAALCTAHRQPVLLQQLEKGHLSKFSGAWQAYTQQTLWGYFDHGLGMVSRNSSGYQAASVEARICRVVWRIQDWVEYAPAMPSGRQPSKYALYYFLGFFLYQGNLVSDGGAARWFFKGARGSRQNSHQYDKPTAVQMVKNIESASPRSLAIAYLLLGLAFNLIAKKDLSLIRQTLLFADSFFPITREELKSLVQCFQPYHLDAIWHSALRNLEADDTFHLAWLLMSR